jgi:phage baseplate assembly protein W
VDPADRAFLGRGWAFPVKTSPDGEIACAEYEQDVHEAVRLVLGTEMGERRMLPEFAAGLRALVFEPLTATTRALVQHRVREALVRFEPRIDVVEVKVNLRAGAEPAVLVDIEYRVRSTNTFYNLVYPFYLLEGATAQ